MMRRGPGIGGLKKQTMAKERFTQLGNKIEQEDNASVRDSYPIPTVFHAYYFVFVAFLSSPRSLSFSYLSLIFLRSVFHLLVD